MRTATAAVVLVCAFAFQAHSDQWVNDTLGCTGGFIDNQCLRVVHGAPHEIAERRRRYEAKRTEMEIIYRGRDRSHERETESIVYRENRRLDREDRYRDERRDREERRDDRHDHFSELDTSPRCRDRRRTVGIEHVSENGARKAAERAWQELVRFDAGEKVSDLTYAEDVRYSCSRSSTAESIISKAAENVGVSYMRCAIEARPCRPRASPLDK